MEIKRGYVKWEDENGFHKEPLVDHPELLEDATPRQQLAAEEVRILNEEGEQRLLEMQEDEDQAIYDRLHELQAGEAKVAEPVEFHTPEEIYAIPSYPETQNEPNQEPPVVDMFAEEQYGHSQEEPEVVEEDPSDEDPEVVEETEEEPVEEAPLSGAEEDGENDVRPELSEPLDYYDDSNDRDDDTSAE